MCSYFRFFLFKTHKRLIDMLLSQILDYELVDPYLRWRAYFPLT